MKQKLPYIAIVLLIVIAIVLNIAIDKKYSLIKENQQKKSSAVLPVTLTPASLTERLLKLPSKDTTSEQQRQHFLLVEQHAVPSAFLDISGCRGNPTVIAVTKGKSVQIKNTDKIAHEISLNQSTHYAIPAKSSQSYQIPFEKGRGIYGYACDHSGKADGVFFVEQ